MFIGIDDVAFKEMKLIKSKLKPKRTIVEQNKIKRNVVGFSTLSPYRARNIPSGLAEIIEFVRERSVKTTFHKS